MHLNKPVDFTTLAVDREPLRTRVSRLMERAVLPASLTKDGI